MTVERWHPKSGGARLHVQATSVPLPSPGDDPQDDLPHRDSSFVHDALRAVDPRPPSSGLQRPLDRLGLGHQPVELRYVDHAVAPADQRASSGGR
jgi:hypothetical protein